MESPDAEQQSHDLEPIDSPEHPQLQDVEWVPVSQASHLLGVDRRTIRRWIHFVCAVCKAEVVFKDNIGWVHSNGQNGHDPEPQSDGNVLAKRTADGWIIRADSLPSYPRLRRPHVGVRLEVTPEMESMRSKISDLASEVGYWRGKAEELQKLLPEAKHTIEQREKDLQEAQRKAATADSLKHEVELKELELATIKKQAQELIGQKAVAEALRSHAEERLKELEAAKDTAIKKAAEEEALRKSAELIADQSRSRIKTFAIAAALLVVASVVFAATTGVFSFSSKPATHTDESTQPAAATATSIPNDLPPATSAVQPPADPAAAFAQSPSTPELSQTQNTSQPPK